VATRNLSRTIIEGGRHYQSWWRSALLERPARRHAHRA